MSEYQYVAFRAIDAPVSSQDMEFMEAQSTRAEITPWSFENEYHYGDFRGDTREMLRRGYDFHLHYANFGTRVLMFRLPLGLPDPAAAKPYLEPDGLSFFKDSKGPGGILAFEPYYEAGDLEEVMDPSELVDELIPVRDEILNGDLRPLYLAHLAIARDGNHDPAEEIEGPVPAGLDKLTNAQVALAEFYGISDDLLGAAAVGAPALGRDGSDRPNPAQWLKSQPESAKDAWLADLIADPNSSVRRTILAEYQRFRLTSSGAANWPTVVLGRSIADLEAQTEEFERRRMQKAADTAKREREKRLARMAADPDSMLREIDTLLAARSTRAYQKIATLLVELREALAGTPRSDLPQQQALALKKKHPTLRLLISALRKEKLLS